MKQSAIYKIQSLIKPEHYYIGSAVDIKDRWRLHLYELRKGIHHSPKLQRHYDKYGKDDLVFRIIEPCLPQFLTIIEDTYLHPLPYFNICPKAGSRLGTKASNESLIKMRIAQNKRNPISDEGRKNMSKAKEGAKQSAETIAKRVAKNTGKKRTEETKEKQRKSALNRPPMSEETKNQISKSKMDHIPWNKGIKKVA